MVRLLNQQKQNPELAFKLLNLFPEMKNAVHDKLDENEMEPI
jgi:hypothetical protein